jgi:hypothetical protein
MPVVRGHGLRRAPGVYRRNVVDEDGVGQLLVVVRFVCRGLGPRRPVARTFSVLPAEVIPRREWSLGWMLKVALWCQDSLVGALDRLSAAGQVVESRRLSRVLEVLGIACERLHQHPVEGVEVEPGGSRRVQAAKLGTVMSRWRAGGRGPPGSLVMAWNTTWRSLLMDVRVR